VLAVWPFQVVRGYAQLLRARAHRLVPELTRYLEINDRLEHLVGPVEVVFGHNDLLAANFIDDGERLWLVDWEYAGLNASLFDLAGLSANNELSGEQEDWLLETYYEQPVTDTLRRHYRAMIAASALREAAWSMLQELVANLNFDYEAYSATNLERFERAYAAIEPC
jgi:thiamine kinase-like enzyme